MDNDQVSEHNTLAIVRCECLFCGSTSTKLQDGIVVQVLLPIINYWFFYKRRGDAEDGCVNAGVETA